MRVGSECLASANARVNILGVGITPLDLSKAVSFVASFLTTGNKGYICVTGMHGIMEAQADPDFRHIQNNSFLTTPDGVPTVWIGRLDGHDTMRQVRGADLMLGLCEASVHTGTRHFLYGGKPGVAELLRDILTLRFPGLQIVGTYTPPFRPLTPQEETELHCLLAESKADVLWCGISTPKQERFMAKYIHRLPVRLMIGVGAAFDLNAGLLNDSPQWVQKCGLQWAHRLCQEPKRLWRRYLLNIPRFLWLYFLQWTGIRSYSLSTYDPPGLRSDAVGAPPAGEDSEKESSQLGNIAA
jgi:N-acetylglucosaminyldiphosphoundecaprenol N-acetyl-beta-D-mannosaminyltransferase